MSRYRWLVGGVVLGATALALAAPAVTEESVVDGSSPVLRDIRLDDTRGKYVGTFGDVVVPLSFHPELQYLLSERLRRGRVLKGATVLLEVPSGRLLAVAEHSQLDPDTEALAFTPFAQSASIFKLISAAELLEDGVSPAERVCYRGGSSRLRPRHLKPVGRRGARCVAFADVVPFSLNAAVAKLVDQHADKEGLEDMAQRLLAPAGLPLLAPVTPPSIHIPDDSFERAKTAAGFGEVFFSPLHAAAMVATIANDGRAVVPYLVAPDEPAVGTMADEQRMSEERPRLLSPKVAERLQVMMRETVRKGTARRRFAHRAESLRQVAVAGKTGSLTDYTTKVHTSWFVGYAPASAPRVVVATAILNDMDLWYVQAIETAKEALELYFERFPEGDAPDTP